MLLERNTFDSIAFFLCVLLIMIMGIKFPHVVKLDFFLFLKPDAVYPVEKLDFKNNMKKVVKNVIKNDVKNYVKNDVKKNIKNVVMNWDSF